MRKLRRLECIAVVILAIYFGGCSSSSSPSSEKAINPGGLSGTYSYQLHVANFHPLDTSSSQYVMWLRLLGDAIWYAAPLDSMKSLQDSLDFSGSVKLPHQPDSIVSAVVSIEPNTIGASPSSILIAGAFYGTNDSGFLSATNVGGVGDYSMAQAIATFTTKSSDTNLAENEFYLMRFIDGVPEASCTNLPNPPEGWSYGLWVLDSDFYPFHQFFYGAFTNSDGPDIDPTNNDYPFPGGYNNAPLNDPSAHIEITLEPLLSVAGNKPVGPSPYVILWEPLSEFISFDDTLALQNVWRSGGPQGILHVH